MAKKTKKKLSKRLRKPVKLEATKPLRKASEPPTGPYLDIKF